MNTTSYHLFPTARGREESARGGKAMEAPDSPPSTWQQLRRKMTNEPLAGVSGAASAEHEGWKGRSTLVSALQHERQVASLSGAESSLGDESLNDFQVKSLLEQKRKELKLDAAIEHLRKIKLRVPGELSDSEEDEEEVTRNQGLGKRGWRDFVVKGGSSLDHVQSRHSRRNPAPMSDHDIQTWVKSIEHKFHSDENSQSQTNRSEQQDMRSRSKLLVRQWMRDSEKTSHIREHARQNRGRVALEPQPVSTLNDPKPIRIRTRDEKNIDSRHKPGSLFSWNEIPFVVEEVESSTARERKAAIEKRKAALEDKRRRALGKKKQLRLIRLEARVQLRRLRHSFEALDMYAQRARAYREEKANIVVSRVEERRTKSLLRKVFHALALFSARSTAIRLRFVRGRAFSRWKNTCKEIISLRRAQEAAAEEKRQREEQMRIANTHFKTNMMRKTLARWYSWCLIASRERKERELEAQREVQKAAFIEAMRQKQHKRRHIGPKALARAESNRDQATAHLGCDNQEQRKGEHATEQEQQTNLLQPENSSPPPPPVERAVKHLTPMEQRAQERKAKRDELRNRRNELEMMRKEEAYQRSVQEKRMQLEAQAQERQKRVAKRRMEEKRAEEMRLKAEEQARLSNVFNRRALLLYCGLKPWKAFVARARLNAEKAMRFYQTRLLMASPFRRWKLFSDAKKVLNTRKSIAMERAAAHFRRRSLLRLGWKLIVDRHERLMARFLAIRSNRKICLRRHSLHTWRERLKQERLRQLQKTLTLMARKKAVVFAAWRALVEEGKVKALETAAKNQMWNKVRGWLNDM